MIYTLSASEVVFFFLFGLAIGSFLNVVIYRLRTGEAIVKDRSRCPRCHATLAVKDLIPLASFLFLAGRCRYCKGWISLQYPLVELATGLLFLFIAFQFARSPFDLVFWLFFDASFIVIIVYDLKWRLIPSQIVWPLLVGAIMYIIFPLFTFQTTQTFQTVQTSIFSSLLTGGFISLIVFLTKERGMGKGDIPIALLLGLLLGYPKGLLALLLSFIIGAIVSACLLIFKKAGLKTEVPFTPFLIIALYVVRFLEFRYPLSLLYGFFPLIF
ncbi:MAG: prepilin peptidase [Candidatus Portnoybacteria bacterium]|nr:prepilin peptidase [Candidatus Portnoybacteria bacterium]